MKEANSILIIILSLAVTVESRGQRQTGNNGFITVDVRKSYSSKKELVLQDFMDVEYIPLETTDEFVNQGFVQDVGKKIILIRNRINDGNIFIYERNGKVLRKINQKGQGGEEYTNILGITLDEDNSEMFVNDIFIRKILVYDLDGKFKRSLKHKEGVTYDRIYNFDRKNLICHDIFLNDDGIANKQSFMIISKQDGRITKEIQIPFKEKKTTMLILKDENGMFHSSSPSTYYPIIPYFDNWILVELSSDTVYRYLPDQTMTPFITRTPSIQSMNPEVFLFLSIFTDRYYFMETVKKIYDFGTNSGFPNVDLMYDKQEKAIFKYTVYNGDFSNKKEVYMKSRPVNDKIASWQALEAHQLVESYRKGELKGKLKEIAATLDEESNPVIMLIKHKK
jgi:hypothetical protein